MYVIRFLLVFLKLRKVFFFKKFIYIFFFCRLRDVEKKKREICVYIWVLCWGYRKVELRIDVKDRVGSLGIRIKWLKGGRVWLDIS